MGYEQTDQLGNRIINDSGTTFTNVDGVTLEVAANILQVKDGGISPDKLSFPLLVPDGTDADPSYSFASNPTSGIFYQPSYDQINLTISGTSSYSFSATSVGMFPSNGSTGLSIDPSEIHIVADTFQIDVWGTTGDANENHFDIISNVTNEISIEADFSATAGDTRFLLWDVTANALVRVSVGANDSGGTGFKQLLVPNS